MVKGMGGAMDLVSGAARVIVLMDPRTPPSCSRACDLPLTGRGVVYRVITDLGVLDVAGGCFRVVELAPGVTFDEVVERTGAPLVAAQPLSTR